MSTVYPALVVRGAPDEGELTALLVVLARCGTAPAPAPPQRAWPDPRLRSGEVLGAGPGAWRVSGLPR